MASGFKGALGALIAGSLLIGSSAAVAANGPARASATQNSAWTALAALNGDAPVTALCGSQSLNGCMLAQADQPPPVPQTGPPPQPIPVPPIESPGGLGLGVDPLLLALGAIVAAGLIYLVVRHHKSSNSPA